MKQDYLVEHDFSMTPFLITDCLVIGCGAAGLRAAIEAAKNGRVLVLAKKDYRFSNTQYAQGGIAAVLTKADDLKKHISDTKIAGAGLCKTSAVKLLVNEGPLRVKELIKWGAKFDKSKNGTIKYTTEGGHSHARILHAGGDATGKEIIETLWNKVKFHQNIKILENHFALDLLHHDHTCYGAMVQNQTSNHIIGILSKQTILASGGSGCVYQDTTNPLSATGDGSAIAYRAGAYLENMEFMQFHPTTLYIAGAPRFLISEAVRGEGAILRDHQGNAFMHKYHHLKDLAPRDIVSKAITDEMIEKSISHVFLDLRHLEAEFIKKRFPTIVKVCQNYNLNLARDLIPVRPSAHYHMGGVKTDYSGKTNIKNLYACGEVASTGCHGANRLASNSLLEALVFGARSGAALEKHKNQNVLGFPLNKTIRNSKQHFDEIDFHDILVSIRSIMWKKVGVYREIKNLKQALSQLEKWDKLVSNCHLTKMEHYEVANILTVAQLITKSALLREESRGAHQRSDFPNEKSSWKNRYININKENFSKLGKK